jgi:nicotinamidase-related amidase
MQENKALLVMDMQIAILSGLDNAETLISQTACAIDYARSACLQIIFVKVEFRHGAPEIHTSNKIFGGSKERYAMPNMEEMMKIHPNLNPTAEDIIVTKRRVSAFSGSDLEIVLRAQEINHIILAGMSTSGVVLSTLREAADKDYLLTVLSDCCGDRDLEVKRVLMEKVFPMQADVLTLEQWKS